MDLRFLEGGWKESESWIQDRTNGQDPPDGLWKDVSGVTDVSQAGYHSLSWEHHGAPGWG